MTNNSHFVDNQDGTVTDTQSGLTWSREDSWQKEGKWVTWDEAFEFSRHLVDLELGGHIDWRLPTPDEALTLYVPEAANKDKYGKTIHLDPVFPEGPQACIWTHEVAKGNEGVVLNFHTGKLEPKFKSVSGRLAARPVHGILKK
ncbi:MAG: DUF1566 domain-containing protein [Nitrospinales bacterium]